MANPQKTALIVSAHSADFVWRAGGAVALYAKRGWRVKVVCLSFGERGESAKLWREPGMTLQEVKKQRRREAETAAEILGAEIEFFDLGDYPMRVPDEAIFKLTDVIRDLRPEFMACHSMEDPYNFDHPLATHVMMEARIIAQAHGHQTGKPPIKAPHVFLYEPHQTEQCNWKPQVILNITEVWDLKRKAFETMAAQEYLWEYYTRVALNRGVQGERNSEMKMTYGEAYQRVYPLVTDNLA